MRLRIQNCEVFSPASLTRFWGYVDIEGERIVRVEQTAPGTSSPPEDMHVIDARGNLLCPSFVDLLADFCDPGHEHREDLRSGSLAAAHGGYTHVFVSPNTRPRCETAEILRATASKADQIGLVEVRPHAALFTREGDLCELADLAEAGARFAAVVDGHVAHGDRLRRAMEYASNFGLTVVLTSLDDTLAPGYVNEGEVSTALGLRQSPREAETTAVYRHLELCELTGASLHLLKVSCADSVELVRKAKGAGLPVTASVAVNNLVHTDRDLLGFDTNFKVRPPLRNEADVAALLAGIRDGTIDAVVSDHSPRSPEEKEVELDRAEFGESTIELCFSLLNRLVSEHKLPLEDALRVMTTGPRKVARLEGGAVEPGARADLVVLGRDEEWMPADDLLSRGRNTPHLRERLKGKVLLTVFRGKVTYDGLSGRAEPLGQ